MKSIASYKRGVAKARRLWREDQFAEALADVGRLLTDWPDNPQLLVMRADLIRLQDDEDGTPTLKDAQADLERAAELGEDSPAALIELGYFRFAYEDNSEAASKCFQEAIRLCRSLLKEALIGRAKALSELNRESEALACLAEALSLASRNGRADVDEILEQLNELQQAN